MPVIPVLFRAVHAAGRRPAAVAVLARDPARHRVRPDPDFGNDMDRLIAGIERAETAHQAETRRDCGADEAPGGNAGRSGEETGFSAAMAVQELLVRTIARLSPGWAAIYSAA